MCLPFMGFFFSFLGQTGDAQGFTPGGNYLGDYMGFGRSNPGQVTRVQGKRPTRCTISQAAWDLTSAPASRTASDSG